MIHGEAAIFLGALGAREGDPMLDRALALVGGEHAVEAYDDDVDEKYLVMADRGVDFLLEDGELETVFIYATETKTRGVYGAWATLFDGISLDSSPDGLVRDLGAPLRSARTSLTYEVEPGFVQFEFDGERLTMAVIMRRLIGAPASTGQVGEEPAPLREPEAIAGEAAEFMRAVGVSMYSPAHMAVIALAGPTIESRDDLRDGVSWQYDYFPKTGVTLQFVDELLVGVLIRLHSDDGALTYPSPESLIDGLSLPAGRDAVGARFGTPRLSSQSMDLYLVGDRYLRFDYEGGRSIALTIVLPGEEL